MGMRPRKVERERQAGVGCRQSYDDREVLRPACSGHNLGHAHHGPSGEEDTLQYLCDHTLELVEKEEVGFDPQSIRTAIPIAGSSGETSP